MEFQRQAMEIRNNKSAYPMKLSTSSFTEPDSVETLSRATKVAESEQPKLEEITVKIDDQRFNTEENDG